MTAVQAMEKAIVKFNNGNLAILCSYCSVIIKTGKDFTQEERDCIIEDDKPHLPPQYCITCQNLKKK